MSPASPHLRPTPLAKQYRAAMCLADERVVRSDPVSRKSGSPGMPRLKSNAGGAPQHREELLGLKEKPSVDKCHSQTGRHRFSLPRVRGKHTGRGGETTLSPPITSGDVTRRARGTGSARRGIYERQAEEERRCRPALLPASICCRPTSGGRAGALAAQSVPPSRPCPRSRRTPSPRENSRRLSAGQQTEEESLIRCWQEEEEEEEKTGTDFFLPLRRQVKQQRRNSEQPQR
ncbi:hypothetical protein AAFF_G00230160 [Aldrovandia affinis]|uniref:Uncharacterized protein n=1 Tax=Aldrovandia affinis TaxID=143900 RepID=A0AAD7SVT4_9TELE|nr:hypothetical protein AAFF_G00230160 [Aldrovandia affinis]